VPFSFVSFLLGKQKKRKRVFQGREWGYNSEIRPTGQPKHV
jgi:hypothetical protein